MTPALVLLVLYGVALLALGWLASRRAASSPEDYFLAGSGLGTVVLFMALFGTNCTPFVLVGIPGRAYHDGAAVFGLNVPIVALGIPLSFWAVGVPARRLARRLGALTPAELFARHLGSRPLGLLLFAVFTLYTLPYMATAVEGASRSLTAALQLDPAHAPLAGAAVLAVAVGYTSLGGMRATAWTNVLQGTLFLGFMLGLAFVLPSRLGGLDAVFASLQEQEGARLFERPENGLYSGGALASWSLVISLTVVSFPHMLVRLVAARSEAALRRVCVLYPLALVALWLPAVLLGLLGRAAFPGLEGRASDQVFTRLVEEVAPAGLGAFGLVAVLAAVMSTLDAQLLTLGSMLSRDVLPGRRDARAEVRAGRAFAVVVAVLVFVLWRLAPSSIFAQAAVAFSGYVTLFPLLLLGLRWSGISAGGAILGVLTGNAVLWLAMGAATGPAPAPLTPVWGGLLPAAWGFLAAAVGTWTGSLALPSPPGRSSGERAAAAP